MIGIAGTDTMNAANMGQDYVLHPDNKNLGHLPDGS